MKLPVSISLVLTSLSLSLFALGEEEWNEEVFAYAPESTNNESSKAPTPSPAQQEPPFFSARPDLSRGIGVLVSGEFLYWAAEEGGLDYALRTPNFTSTVHPVSTQLSAIDKGVHGTLSRVGSDYHPGYRLNALYQSPWDQWDISFHWTKYNSKNHGHCSAKDNEILFMKFVSPEYLPSAESGKASWSLDFNTLEFDIGRAFSLGKSFSVNFFGGFKAAWIEQLLRLRFENVTFNSGESVPELVSKNRNNFAGYGVNIGLDGKWTLPVGFYLFGHGTAGLLFGKFHLNHFEKFPTPRSHLKESFSETLPELELQGGIGWEYHFASDRLYLNIYAAFEEQLWFNQNQLVFETSEPERNRIRHSLGDLSLAGWTIGATLGF